MTEPATAGAVALPPAAYALLVEQLMTGAGQIAADYLEVAYRMWQAGHFTTDDLAARIVSVIAAANNGVRDAADSLGSEYLRHNTSGDVTPAGVHYVTVDDEIPRLTKAAQTLVQQLDTGDDGLAMQLERIAHNEPADAAQQQLLHTYSGHGVNGYRRHLNADACELCQWLVKAHLDPEGIGFIYPANKPMHRHTGCRCTPVPAIKKVKTR